MLNCSEICVAVSAVESKGVTVVMSAYIIIKVESDKGFSDGVLSDWGPVSQGPSSNFTYGLLQEQTL